MTITPWYAFKVAIAIGAGYEFGRVLPGTVIQLLSKSTLREMKTEYKRRLKVVPNTNRAPVDFTKPRNAN